MTSSASSENANSNPQSQLKIGFLPQVLSRLAINNMFKLQTTKLCKSDVQKANKREKAKWPCKRTFFSQKLTYLLAVYYRA